MSDANDIVLSMCEKYQAAVSANDSATYKKLFADDAIRVPPGSEPEHGPDEIAASEQRDYDVAKWSIQSRPLDVLRIADDWIYAVAHVDVSTEAHTDGSKKSFAATKTWLLHRQPTGDWLIKRQMWNLK